MLSVKSIPRRAALAVALFGAFSLAACSGAVPAERTPAQMQQASLQAPAVTELPAELEPSGQPGLLPEREFIPPSPMPPAKPDEEPLPLPLLTPGGPGGLPKREFIIEQARTHLAERLGLDPQEITFVSLQVEPGEPLCPLIKATPLPQPVLRNHTTLILQAGETQYTYLVDGIYLTLCNEIN